MNQAVTELIVRGRTEGVKEARAEVEALERAHEKAQGTIEKATIGMERMSARVQSRLDPQFRATQQLAKVEADLDLLRSKGLITLERQNALVALATQKYAALGAAGTASAVGIAAPGQAAQLSAFQMQNLTFQMNDIATGLATGQSPFRIMAQQGGQVVQIFGSGTGVVAAVKAAGAAMLSFVTNPLTLAVIGFGLALEVGMRFFSSIRVGASDVETHLKRHNELIDSVRDRWQAAEKGVHDYAAASRTVLTFEAQRNAARLQADFDAAARGLAPTPLVGGGPIASFGVGAGVIQAFPEIEAAVRRVRDSARDGRADIKAFRDEIAAIGLAAPAGSALREIAFRMLDASQEAVKLQAELERARDVERGLAGDTQAMNRALGESARGFASAADSAGQYVKALEALQGIAVAPLSARDRAAASLRLAVDAAQGLDDAAVALDAYASALERIGTAEAARAAPARQGVRAADPMAEFNDLLADRRRALAEEAGALGLSETALAKYRTEIDLTNAAMRLFGTVSPEMAAQIRALGDAAAAAVAAQQRLAEQIAAMDSLRGDVRGFLGDLASGLRQGESAADALKAALDRLLDRLLNMGLDMIVAGLFGQQGTAGGGLSGNLFSGLFSGLSGGVSSTAGTTSSLGPQGLGSQTLAPIPVEVKALPIVSTSGLLTGGGGTQTLAGGNFFDDLVKSAQGFPDFSAPAPANQSTFFKNSSKGMMAIDSVPSSQWPGFSIEDIVPPEFTTTVQQSATEIAGGAETLADSVGTAASAGEQFASGVTDIGTTAQNSAGQLSSQLPQAMSQIIQSISSAGGTPFGGFPGGSFFGMFGGFGGAPGFTPGVVLSRHQGGLVTDGLADNDNLRLADPRWFRDAVRAHGGLDVGGMRLAPDERPIIAQTGERVLSRAETAAFERRGSLGSSAAPSISIRGGDVIVQGNADERTLPLIRAEIAASEARMQRDMKANVGHYQSRWSTFKASA
jgi:hypothetical protein